MKPIAILGAGNGGCAMTAHLTLQGWPVHLCGVYDPSRIEGLRKRGGIELAGAAGTGFAIPDLMTTNLAEAIQDADLIIWTIPANGHAFYVRQIAPYLKPHQILILTPGAVGGALFVSRTLHQMNIKDIPVGETATLPYGCRLVSDFRVEVYDVARHIPFAMFPDVKTDEVLKRIQSFLPNLIRGNTVLETSLNYINMLLHPVGMILNAGWIEHRKGDFAYYYDGISPAVARILEEVDQERLAILRALQMDPIPFVDWFFRRGKTETKESVYQAIHSSVPNRNFRAPAALHHRFILEDVPFGLVPLSQFGRLTGVATPVTDALILLSSRMFGKDFFKEGRSLEDMGISGMTPDRLKSWVQRRAGTE